MARRAASLADQAPSLRRTSSFTAFPSTVLPASSAITAFMTRPMSFCDAAPVDAMAASTACSSSAAPTAARQVALEHRDLRGFLVGQIFAAALEELLDGIAPLLDEAGHHLARFVFVERPASLHLAVHQRRFQHPQRRPAAPDPSPSSLR